MKLLTARALLIVTLTFLSASCSLFSKKTAVSTPIEKPKPVLYEWNDDGGPGKVSITIDRAQQRAFYKRGSRDIGWSAVSTGKEGHTTSAGNFSITEKIADKHSNAYGWMEDAQGNVVNGDASSKDRVPKGLKYIAAPMPYWMRLTSYGVGMHAGIIPEDGSAASHGCIRLPKEFAPVLFGVTKVGTPVTIK